ncbi:MAG: hypothetical protein JW869_03485 [Candidatus Omnitrophica bacterium]|nr:hypothetical protein [Candidatus Omnitrophota bacterium]
MKRMLFCLFLLLICSGPASAIDEDTYVNFVVDSTITMYELKGRSEGTSLWAEEMEKKYPNFMAEDWKTMEERLDKDPQLRDTLYGRIITNIRSQGYNAQLKELENGKTTIEIRE